MPDSLLFLTEFSSTQFGFAVLCCFLAGVVRGFAGFALSALIMSSLVVILPPIQLLPICFTMELLAGLIMSRSGIRHAKMAAVAWLIAGSIIGVPIGTYATVHMPVDVSRNIVLSVIILLALAQLLVSTPKLAASTRMLIGTGIVAGIVTGLAHVGGMLVALYVLAQKLKPAETRATLVMFLLAGSLTTGISLYLFGIFNAQALWRSLLLAPAVAAGVIIGSLLFNPALQPYYRRFCLVLLVGIAGASLVGSVLR